MKGIEVTWDTALLTGLWTQTTSALCLGFSTSPQPPGPQSRGTPFNRALSLSQVCAAARAQSRRAPRPAPFRRLARSSRDAQEPRCMPGVVVSVAAVRRSERPAARGRKRKQCAARPQLRPAPRRAAPLAAVLALTCLLTEVQRSRAGWAADSLTSLAPERSRSGIRSQSSRRHGEWVPRAAPATPGRIRIPFPLTGPGERPNP